MAPQSGTRFFATARWSLDQVGLAMLGLVVGWLTPTGAPLLVAVDDTLFRRTGRHVHGAFWAYDGSRSVAAGQAKLSRGTTFVIAAVVVDLPFLPRPIALPVLFRLWRPGGPTKTTLARELIRLIAAARAATGASMLSQTAPTCARHCGTCPPMSRSPARCLATRRCGISTPIWSSRCARVERMGVAEGEDTRGAPMLR